MKCRTEQGLVERVNVQSSFATTCTLSDNGTLHKCLHRTVGQHLATVLLLVISVGLGLGTAATEAQTRAYVTNSQDNTVSVIDTATNTVVATVPVGVNPSGIAITPDGTRAYTANGFTGASNTVSVMETATNTVVATITVGEGPSWVAITPDGTRAYVTDFGFGSVSVIDTATNTVDELIRVIGGPVGVAFTPIEPEPT